MKLKDVRKILKINQPNRHDWQCELYMNEQADSASLYVTMGDRPQQGKLRFCFRGVNQSECVSDRVIECATGIILTGIHASLFVPQPEHADGNTDWQVNFHLPDGTQDIVTMPSYNRGKTGYQGTTRYRKFNSRAPQSGHSLKDLGI